MKNVFRAAFVSLLLFTGVAAAAININTANEAQLMELTGIGAVKAEAIITYREANGDFASVAELDNVDGIGAGTLESFEGQATVDAAE